MSKMKVVQTPDSLMKAARKSLGDGRLPEAVEFAKKACESASTRKDAVLDDAKELALSCAVKDPTLANPVAKLLMTHLELDHDEAHLLIETRIRRGPEKKPDETKRFEHLD